VAAASNLLTVRDLSLATPRAQIPRPAPERAAAPPVTAGAETLRVLGLLAEGPSGPCDALFARVVRVAPGRCPGPWDRENPHPPLM
jgi:hypothetical protein